MPLEYGGLGRRVAAFGLDAPVFFLTPFLEASAAQASWGKRALGLRMMESDGRRVWLGRALGRDALKFAPFVLPALGGWGWWVLGAHIAICAAGVVLSQRRQTWYERVCRTAVIRPPV